MKRSYLLGSVRTFLILCSFNTANAMVIDFETVPGSTPSDQLAISNQYQADYGVTFSLSNSGTPHLEKTGGDDPGTGFEGSSGLDTEDAEFAGLLGNYFLRLGTDALQSAPAPTLIITYDNAVSAASAQIWDIDGNAFGTEQWQITALDNGNQVIDTLLSPLGTEQGPTSLDGQPWTWSFDHESNDIYAIQIAFTGSKSETIGLALDNFSPATAAIPIPAAIWLFGSGLFGLIGISRRMKAA
jgi:hypothetical protein